jgi:hypothetical protein
MIGENLTFICGTCAIVLSIKGREWSWVQRLVCMVIVSAGLMGIGLFASPLIGQSIVGVAGFCAAFIIREQIHSKRNRFE